MKLRKRILATVSLASIFLFAPDVSADTDKKGGLALESDTSSIKINFFYHGSQIHLKGEMDANHDVIVRITSPEIRHTLKKKGKVGGLLWMNVGDLTFDRAPGFYHIHSNKHIGSAVKADEADRHLLGYEALGKHVRISPSLNEMESSVWFGEFLKLKESQKLYRTTSATVKVTPSSLNRQKYELVIDWPYEAPPGEYAVTVLAVKDGIVQETRETALKVEQEGVVKSLSEMANKNEAFYGILSIGVALGAGFGVGMIFKKGRNSK